MYSCVGIQAGRFVCSVLTLEAAMSGEVQQVFTRVGLRMGKFVELDYA